MKVSVVGVGRLGAQVAYILAIRGFVDDLLLVDAVPGLAAAQAADIGQAAAKTRVSAAEIEDVSSSDVIFITAGKARGAQMSRLELLEANIRIVGEIARRLTSTDGIVITATNPVDVMNYLVWKVTKLDRRRVIGFGASSDAVRLRMILAEELRVKVGDVDAQVIGEHGDDMVALLGSAKVGGKAIKIKNEAAVRERLKNFAVKVIAAKGATEFGPAAAAADLIEAIARGTRAVVPCSVILEGEYGLRGLSIGALATIGSRGVEKIIEAELNDAEAKLFNAGAKKLKRLCDGIDKVYGR